MQDFQKLQVWQKAHHLTLAIYRISACFPSDERFGLTSQIRRSAASVGANLAEGTGRATPHDFANFVSYASGSIRETEYHLILAHDLGFIVEADRDKLMVEVLDVQKMLRALYERLHA